MFTQAARAFSKAGSRGLATASAKAANNQRLAMGAAAAAVGVVSGIAAHKSDCLKIEIDDATAKKLLSALGSASKADGPRYNELLPPPAGAKIKCCVVECAQTYFEPPNACEPPPAPRPACASTKL